jgi:hypothetical protein
LIFGKSPNLEDSDIFLNSGISPLIPVFYFGLTPTLTYEVNAGVQVWIYGRFY